MDAKPTLETAIVGSLIGTALGDALGLWCEGMSRRRLQRFGKQLDRYHFLFGRGMVSDDTEHACMVAQALIASAGDEDRFLKSLGWRMRWWLLALPAGTGRATALAIAKLWLGFSPRHSGAFSAGNGPAMRSPLLGVCFRDDVETLRTLVRASTRITHRDPKAEYGAMAVAWAAALASRDSLAEDLGERFLYPLRQFLDPGGDALLALLKRAVASAAAGQETEHFAGEMGLAKGVSGYVYHTVPVVIHAWLRHRGDFRSAVLAVIRCGGDTDSTAAIVGGIVGAASGKDGLPEDWRRGICEWPCSLAWIEGLGERLAQVISQNRPGPPLRIFPLSILLRNLFFLTVVLLHGFRRCLPPY